MSSRVLIIQCWPGEPSFQKTMNKITNNRIARVFEGLSLCNMNGLNEKQPQNLDSDLM